MPLALSLATSWTGLEWLRGHVLTGFPWNLAAYTLADWLPFAQVASLVGSYGLGVTLGYMVVTYEPFGFGASLWWDIKPIAAGIFGVPMGFLGVLVGSLLTKPPAPEESEVAEWVRFPDPSASRRWQDGDLRPTGPLR